MPTSAQLNANNFGLITCEVGNKPCEGPRAIHVPLSIFVADFIQPGGSNTTPRQTFTIDLSTLTQGMPSPKLSMVQGLIVNNHAPVVDGTPSGNAAWADVVFDSGFKLTIPQEASGYTMQTKFPPDPIVTMPDHLGGLFYFPIPVSSPSKLEVTVFADLFTISGAVDQFDMDFYFTNYPIFPASFNGGGDWMSHV